MEPETVISLFQSGSEEYFTMFLTCKYLNGAVGYSGNDLHLVLVKTFINESDYQLV